MPAPLVWIGVVAAAVAANALWGDDDVEEAARNAGVDPESTVPSDLTPEQVAAISEEMAKLPPESQARAQQVIQQQMQATQGQQTTGGTDLGGLSGQLAPGDPAADGAADPEGFTHEGHTFSEPPPGIGEAPPIEDRESYVEGFDRQGRLTDPYDTGTEQVDEIVRLLQEDRDTATTEAIGAGHTPAGDVLPYLESLHEWAREGGTTAEGYYRSRYYRQEAQRLARELEARRSRAGDSVALGPDERNLRDIYDAEGSLTPWEQWQPLPFPETDLQAPASRAGTIAERVAAGRPDQDLDRYGFAPFGRMADRDAGTPSGLDTSGLIAALGEAGWDDASLSAIDQSALAGDPNSTQVYVRRPTRVLPGGNYRADTSSIRGIQRTEQALAEASSFTAGRQELINELHRMSDTEVEKFQTELWKAGFYGDAIPIKGDASDGATIAAFEAAIDAAAGYAAAGEIVTLEEVIERRQQQMEGRLGDLLGRSRGLSAQSVQVNLEDPAGLRELVEQTAIETIGAANLSEEQMQQFISRIHSAQREQATSRQAAVNEAVGNWQPETPWDEPPDAIASGAVYETTGISAGARAEDFVEEARPGEAAATDFANSYEGFLDMIGGR